MKIDTDPEKIEHLLSHGVEEVFVKDHLRERLLSGEQLRVKFGIDPTGPTIHLGRAIPLRKLREFQDLGHKVIFLVGDFTAQIGDPSDKLEKRPTLTKEQIKQNMKDYKKIAGKILDMKKTEMVYNSKWLKKMSLLDLLQLSDTMTLQQIMRRNNFKNRLENEEDIMGDELWYPLMQGYDSVELRADVEIGGFDQLFNLQAGRKIQKKYGMHEQDIITTVMLEGTDGRKMSTSWGNVVNITDEPADMFGKLMALHDNLIGKYFELCTDLPIEGVEDDVRRNPKGMKMKLAREIVTVYHGEVAAAEAEEDWEQKFSRREVPDELQQLTAKQGQELADILVEAGILESKSAFGRLVEEGAVKNLNTDEKITNKKFVLEESLKVKVGKKKFLEIVVK